MIAVFDEALEITIVSAPKKDSSARKSSIRNDVKNSGKNRMCSASRVDRVDGIGLDVAVALVGRWQRGPVRGGVDESLLVDAVWDDQQVAGARQVAVDADALRQVGVPRLLDVGVAPDVELSPVRVRGGEEVPVVHRFAEHGVGDVVRGQPERLDAKEGLSVFGRRRVSVQKAGLMQVGAAQLEVHAHEPMG